MRRGAHIFIAFASIAAAGCGDPDGSRATTTPPITSPTAPTTPTPVSTYTLSGVVKEAWIDTGLPGVTVAIASGPIRGTTTTDEQGRYSLSSLLPGVYQLTYSKSAPYPTRSSGPLNVFTDTTHTTVMSIAGPFPATTADLTGYWVGQGPYPNEPCWLLIMQKGTTLEGWYKDRRDYSTALSGTYVAGSVSMRVGGTELTIEGRVEDARCIRAFVKNEALGGNFPIAISRGGNCAR
jgi:Carboxypeptidase regulatory-like domain